MVFIFAHNGVWDDERVNFAKKRFKKSICSRNSAYISAPDSLKFSKL